MAGLQYRRPAVEEAETMAALHVQCWRESYHAFLPADLVASFSVEKRLPTWEAITQQPERIVYGAFDGNVPVGLAVAGAPHEKLFEGDEGQLAALYIAKAFHRKGIGRALLGVCARDWLRIGGTSLSLSVLADNIASQQFYESLGAKFLFPSEYNWEGNILKTKIYVFHDLEKLIP